MYPETAVTVSLCCGPVCIKVPNHPARDMGRDDSMCFLNARQFPEQPYTHCSLQKDDFFEDFLLQGMNNQELCRTTKKLKFHQEVVFYHFSLHIFFWSLWLQLPQIGSLNHLQPLFQITPPNALLLTVPVAQVHGSFPVQTELHGSCFNKQQNNRCHWSQCHWLIPSVH